jgi:hypothetical protein
VGTVIPLEPLGIGAMSFLFPWAIYHMTLQGIPMERIVGVCLVAGVIDWPLEWSAIHCHVFEYYGNNPSRVLSLPFTSMAQNCFIYALMAAAILTAAAHLRAGERCCSSLRSPVYTSAAQPYSPGPATSRCTPAGPRWSSSSWP